MKVSLKWMQWYSGNSPALKAPIDTLTQKIGAQLGAIEEVENLGEKYQGIIVAKVVSLKDHENSDHLHVVMIDDGGAAKDVARDANGYVQVVCGAGNLYEGMLVPWLPPGVTVPESIGSEPFVLEARELRGVVSNGMLASARELALGTDHSGIVDLTGTRHPGLDPGSSKKDVVEGHAVSDWIPNQVGNDRPPRPGDDFAKLLELDDYIIDIENKMFTHRPDCFGQLGVAREIAGIMHEPFHSPDWYVPSPAVSLRSSAETLPVKVQNELTNLVPRFVILAMNGVTIKPSPLWLQTYLLRVGVRPINNIVDVTNYYALLTGQPLHAYDYDKVKARSTSDAAIVVRYPRPGEKVKLLNGKEIEPRSEAIMIATDEELIGVAGVMGGADTEVDDQTKNIILECGTFDMYSIRRTSMAHGLFSEAVTRFNKGQSPLQNMAIAVKAVSDISDYSGAQLAGPIQDLNQQPDREWVHPPVPVSTEFINARLGLKLSAAEMKQLLENVEFTVELSSFRHPGPGPGSSEKGIAEGHATSDLTPNHVGNDGAMLTVTAPFWRTDIETREDVVEEIGRLYGYDKLPLELPTRSLQPAAKDEQLELKASIRAALARGGANEVLTYSFVHGNLLDKVGQDTAHAFQISNAISPDLQYYRTALIPSLLDKVHANSKAGYDQFALFELGKVHYKGEMDAADANVPNEDDHVALVVAHGDKQAPAGAAYYAAKRHLGQLIDLRSVKLVPLTGFDLNADEWGKQLTAPYEPGRTAVIVRDDQIWGVVGEFKASARRALKLPAFTAGFEVHLALLAGKQTRYTALPRFPKVAQDICLKVPAETSYQAVYDLAAGMVAEAGPDSTVSKLEPVDIYQRPDDPAHKQVTLRLTIASYERTLTDTEVAKLLDEVSAAAKAKLDAERV